MLDECAPQNLLEMLIGFERVGGLCREFLRRGDVVAAEPLLQAGEYRAEAPFRIGQAPGSNAAPAMSSEDSAAPNGFRLARNWAAVAAKPTTTVAFNSTRDKGAILALQSG